MLFPYTNICNCFNDVVGEAICKYIKDSALAYRRQQLPLSNEVQKYLEFCLSSRNGGFLLKVCSLLRFLAC